jgi:hypothetical protein
MSRPRILTWTRFSKTNDTILDHKGLFCITRSADGTSFSLHVSTELGGPGLNRRAVESYESVALAKDSAARTLYPKDKFTAPIPRVKRKYTKRVIAPPPAPAKRAKATKAKATKAAAPAPKRAAKVTAPVPAKRARKAAVKTEAPAPVPTKRARKAKVTPPIANTNDAPPAVETEAAAA